MKWRNKGHEFDSIGNIYARHNKILIYGAGNEGRRIFDKIEKYDILDGFIDKDEKKQKTSFCGKPVYSPDIIFEKFNEEYVILVAFETKKNEELIMNRLKQRGYVEGIHCFRGIEFINKEELSKLSLFMLYAKNRVIATSFCIIPSNFCNLNCKHCLNFTPYIKKFRKRDFFDVRKDIDTLFKWLYYTYRFQISGGEPLMYENLDKIISYVGEKYRDKMEVFEIVINGTIVPNEELLKLLKKYHVTVYLDNYTSEISSSMNKRDEIIKRLNEHDVFWIDNTVESWFDLDIMNKKNNFKSEMEIEEYFDYCNNPWHCYEDGKVYSCNFAQFAVWAEINSEDETSYFDLNNMSTVKTKEFYEFLANYNEKGYVDMCKNCEGWCRINNKTVKVAEQV